ncbi:hypothetical protein [Yunchengibacter salinarum]|uniref:hypothetical protein n=1 Tax=Yunchengibacter salinarum TaxID=3133399 RepID=UPI0035B59B0B
MPGRILIFSFVISALMPAGQHNAIAAMAAADPIGPEQGRGLVVPVRPKGRNLPPSLAVGQRLTMSYLVLPDGGVISLADWILAPLSRHDAARPGHAGGLGVGASAYDRRLFLGAGARAMAGLGDVRGQPPGRLRPIRGVRASDFGHVPYVPITGAPAPALRESLVSAMAPSYGTGLPGLNARFAVDGLAEAVAHQQATWID